MLQEDDSGDRHAQGWAVFDTSDGRARYWTRSRVVAIITASYTGLSYARAELPDDERRTLLGKLRDPYGVRPRRNFAGWILVALAILALGVRLVRVETAREAMDRVKAALKPLLDQAR